LVDRLVAMPADRRSPAVLRDERLGERLRGESREGGGSRAQRQQKGGGRGGRPGPPRGVAVGPAGRGDSAAAEIAAELELLEGKGTDPVEEVLLVAFGQELRGVAKALGRLGEPEVPTGRPERAEQGGHGPRVCKTRAGAREPESA